MNRFINFINVKYISTYALELHNTLYPYQAFDFSLLFTDFQVILN